MYCLANYVIYILNKQIYENFDIISIFIVKSFMRKTIENYFESGKLSFWQLKIFVDVRYKFIYCLFLIARKIPQLQKS